MTEDEKRGETRVTINQEFASFDAFIQEYVTNVSKNGLFIRSKSPPPIGSKVELHFTVIMDDIETIQGVAEVVRVVADGMGVQFLELTPHSRELIDRLIDSKTE